MAIKLFKPSEFVTITTPPSNSSWVTKDLSSYLPSTATAVILKVEQSTFTTYKLRQKGSNEDPPRDNDSGIVRFVKLNSSKQIEVYTTGTQSNGSLVLKIVGYCESETVLFDDIPSIDFSSLTNNAYNTVSLSGNIPAGAVAVILEASFPDIGATQFINYAARAVGSTYTDKVSIGWMGSGTTASTGPQWGRSSQIVALNSSRQIQVYVQQSSGGYRAKGRILGYITAGGIITRINPTLYPAIASQTWTDLIATTNNGGFFTGIYKYRIGGIETSYNQSTFTVAIAPNSDNHFEVYNNTAVSNFGEFMVLPPSPIQPPKGTLTLSGKIPAIYAAVTIFPPKGTLALSGKLPVMYSGASATVPIASLTFTSFIPRVSSGASAKAPKGILALSGKIPEIKTPIQINVPLKPLLLDGKIPKVGAGASVKGIPVGQFALSGKTPSKVSAGASAKVPSVTPLVLSGKIPILRTGVSARAPAGFMSFGGYKPVIATGVSLQVPVAHIELIPRLPKANARPRSFAGAVNTQTIDEVFIILMTIEHPSLSEPINLANDVKDVLTSGVRGVISNDVEYVYLPFNVILPSNDGTIPVAKISIDNISREIIAAIADLQTPPTVRLQIALSTDADIIEYDIEGFQLKSVTYDAMTIEAELSVEYFIAEPYPAPRFTPSRFPGLFRGRNLS